MTRPERPKGYPLPWRWEESWTGARVLAANGRTVALLRIGTQALHVEEEQALAEQIVTAVNERGEA